MSWDAAIHGHLHVPSQTREAWLATTVDWAAVEGHDVWPVQTGRRTVRDLLAFELDDEPIRFIELTWTGDDLQLAGFMDKDTFIDVALPILAACAAAAPHGATGELIAMGMLTASFGYRLSVSEGRARFEKLPDSEVPGLDDHPDAQAIQARVLAAMDEEFGEDG